MPRLDRFFSLYCVNPLRKLGRVKDTAIPILMYHSISNERETGYPYFWLNTSLQRFAEHMRFLKQHDYMVIALDRAVEILGAEDANACDGSTAQRCVVLTFDDGLRDFLTQAYPILAEFGFTATVFLPTGSIGDCRQSFNSRDCLTWAEVRTLRDAGMSFGSHSVSHSKLYGMPWEQIRRELRDSRLRIENELQTAVRWFSYPYAFPQEDQGFVQRLRQELVDQCYVRAVTTVIGRAQRGGDPLFLKRLPVNGADDLRFLEAKMAGAYDWLAAGQAIVRRAKKRSRAHRPSEQMSAA